MSSLNSLIISFKFHKMQLRNSDQLIVTNSRNALVVVLLMCCQRLNAQVSSNGSCSQIQPIEDFNAREFQGVWYLVAKYPTLLEIGTTCMSISCNLITNSNMSVEHRMMQFGEEIKIEGSAVLDGSKKGLLNMILKISNECKSVVRFGFIQGTHCNLICFVFSSEFTEEQINFG